MGGTRKGLQPFYCTSPVPSHSSAPSSSPPSSFSFQSPALTRPPFPHPASFSFIPHPLSTSLFSSGRFRVACVIRRYARVNCLFVFLGRGMQQDGLIPSRKVRLVAGPLAYRLAVAMRRASGRLGPRKDSRSRPQEEGEKWGRSCCDGRVTAIGRVCLA